MFQTEFCGSDYKFVISWDSDANLDDGSIDEDQNLFYKLNELYDNISKFTTEFVDCVKRVPNSTDDGQEHELNPNMSFKIENSKNTEAYSDEVFLLRKEVEKLKNQKEQIEIDYKNCMLRHTEEISKLREDEEAKLRKLENKYKLEMSDLRIYFENSYTDYLKQLTELISSQYTRSKVSDVSSTSENETGNETYEITDLRCCDTEFDQHFTIRDHACKLEVSDESKIKIKENINKDLKNIIKTYNTEINKFKKDLEARKNEEVEEAKRCMDVKYGSIIETLQSEVNQLLYNKALEDKVKELHSILKKESIAEFHNLQNDVDNVFLERAKDERDALEQDLKSRFQDQLIELSNEWRNKFEELLSDIVVDSAVKNVTYEINRKPVPLSPKKLDEEHVNSKTIEKEYKEKLDRMKDEYESRIQMMVSNFEENAEKLHSEKETLAKEFEELQKLNDNLRAEIENLKVNFVSELKTLQSSQDIDVEKMDIELKNLRKIHEAEISCLRGENAHLREKINEILEQDFDQEKRSEIISQLYQEIEDLIVKEENGDCITWPSDLANFEDLFARKFCPEKPLVVSSPDNVESETHSTEESDVTNLDEILRERDALRKVNVALHGVVKVFTKYLTNCEEELNNTLVNELVKGDHLRRNFSNSFEGDSLGDISDMNFDEGVKKVHFAPDVSELLNSLCADWNHDITSNRSVSVLESELNACLERLKNEAAAVLCLTAGKKMDANEPKLTVAAQTDLSDDQLRRNEEKIKSLEEGLSSAEVEIENLTEEIDRLTKKINNMESIEAYGEGFNAPLLSGRFQNNAESDNAGEFNTLHYSDEFCSKCEKVIEEAKKEIEDRQAQVQAADNKLKSLNQFLERQTTERENERFEFDKRIEKLQEQLKEKERDYVSKYGTEISNLQQQNKKLTLEMEQYQNIRENLEAKVKSYQAKIVKSKESADDLENKLSQKSELIRRLEAKLKEKEDELHQFQKEYQILFQQLESLPENNIKTLEELNEQHVTTAAMIDQVKNEIYEVEKLVISRTRELENMYLPVVSSSIISSPSEDVSVCDRIADRVKVTSPSDSDLSSPIHVPINQLSCLHDKLKRLFRAEEAALKKIQDQDMQLNKLSSSLIELELENHTLSENLSKTSAKLSEAKTELNNWQHGHSSAQSEIQLELSRTIESLENEIQYLKRCIDQKDENIRELTSGVRNAENAREVDLLRAKVAELQSRCEKQAESLSETEKHDRTVNKRLSTMLSEREAEIKRLQQKVSSLSSSAGYSRFNQTDTGTPLKRTRISFEDNSEFDDSDVSRHAAVAEISAAPRYLSIVSEIPVTKLDLNESLLTHSVRFNEKLDAEPITSVYLESDVPSGKSDSKDYISQRDTCGNRIKTTKRKLTSIQEDDIDGKDSTITPPEIPQVSISLEDHQSVREVETEYQKKVSELQTKLQDANQELDGHKEQCSQLESRICGLSVDVDSKLRRIQELSEKEQQLEADLEEKRREINDLKKRQRKFENLNKEVVKERVEAQRKCEEYSHSLQQLEQRLTVEQGRSTNLSEELENGKIEQAALRQKVTQLETELETVGRELQETREKVKYLMEIGSKMEDAKYHEADLSDKSIGSSLEHRSSSLRNLTEKVQKEVERAEEMDKNILKSLESDSRGTSFIDELMKISSSLSDHLKRILFKMLQEGPEGLSIDEKNVLIQSCGQNELDLIYQAKLKDEIEKRLRLQLEIEQKSNRELINDNRKMTLDLSRSELLLGYYDERMTFLVSKLDEYRNKAVKVEIELTSERTSRKQLEISFESYKREMYERQIQNNKKLDEAGEHLNMALNENVKLKREIDSMANALEILTAELNSVKIITHYQSDSESDVSHSLSPLKAKLSDIQEKYSRVKQELETKKEELREIRSSWNADRANHQKLEHLYSVALEEKSELQTKLVDMKLKFEDILWQKQKVDEKLEAVELYEVKRRMARVSKDENLRKEQELMRSEQAKLERECKRLRENLLKINDEHATLLNDWKRVCEELKIIFYRMLKAEKNQRCLVFQKIYFIQMLQRCKLEFVTLTQSKLDASRLTHDYVYFSISNSDLAPKQKFKSIGLCLIMMRRIRFLVKRRASSNHSKMVNYFHTNLPGTSIYPWCNTSSVDGNKKEIEKKSYKLTGKSKDFPFECPRTAELSDPLKSIFEQFTNLRDAFVCPGPSKSTGGKI